MDQINDRIRDFTLKNTRVVTFIHGDTRIAFPVWKIEDDSSMFRDLFGDVTRQEFEVDIDKIPNLVPELFIRYLAALMSKYKLTDDDCYKLYVWLDSEMVHNAIRSRTYDMIKNKQKDGIIKFITFIIENKTRMNDNIDSFLHNLVDLARDVLLTWEDLEKCPLSVCMFVMELYYCFYSVKNTIHVKVDKNDKWRASERNEYPNKIFATKKLGNNEYVRVFQYYMILFRLSEIPKNASIYDYCLTELQNSYLVVFNKMRLVIKP
jgi:hypothetical protein